MVDEMISNLIEAHDSMMNACTSARVRIYVAPTPSHGTE
jgi:hypothetical protein